MYLRTLFGCCASCRRRAGRDDYKWMGRGPLDGDEEIWRGTNVLEGSITSAILIASVVSRYALCQRGGGEDDNGENDRGGETHVEIWSWGESVLHEKVSTS